MTRLVLSALVVLGFGMSPALASGQQEAGVTEEAYLDAHGERRVRTVRENSEVLRQQYVELAKEMAEELSDQELRVELASLAKKHAAMTRKQQKDQLASEIEGKLSEAIEYFGELATKHAHVEAGAVAGQIQKSLREHLDSVGRWKAGELSFPESTYVPITPNTSRSRSQPTLSP